MFASKKLILKTMFIFIGVLTLAFCIRPVKAPACSQPIGNAPVEDNWYILQRGETYTWMSQIQVLTWEGDWEVSCTFTPTIDPLNVTYDPPIPFIVYAGESRYFYFNISVPVDAPTGEYPKRFLVKFRPIGGSIHSWTEFFFDIKVIDTFPPRITVLSPENTTYLTDSVPLVFTLNEPTSWIRYSLDEQVNVTITGNTTITNLTSGSHNVVVYVNDTNGNMGVSDKVYFTRVI
jgi:hypothetical protein